MTDKSAIELDGEANELEARLLDLRRQAAAQRGRDRQEAQRKAAETPVDRSARVLTDGAPVPEDNSHTETRPDGQQMAYVVLSDAERAKGFVRPVRDAYRHVGVRPKSPTRPLTAEEQVRFADAGYVAFEPYPEGSRARGRFWTQAELESGCGAITTMGRSLAETYARDPEFYGGTFCSICRKHFPVGEKGEFTWYENDGSEGPRVGT